MEKELLTKDILLSFADVENESPVVLFRKYYIPDLLEQECRGLNSISKVTFHNIDFSHLNFNCFSVGPTPYFENVKFHGCKFDNTIMPDNPNFKNCEFEGCTFNNSILVEADFVDCCFFECNLYSTILSGALFKNCDIVSSSFNKVNLLGSKFIDCDFFEFDADQYTMNQIRATPDSGRFNCWVISKGLENTILMRVSAKAKDVVLSDDPTQFFYITKFKIKEYQIVEDYFADIYSLPRADFELLETIKDNIETGTMVKAGDKLFGYFMESGSWGYFDAYISKRQAMYYNMMTESCYEVPNMISLDNRKGQEGDLVWEESH